MYQMHLDGDPRPSISVDSGFLVCSSALRGLRAWTKYRAGPTRTIDEARHAQAWKQVLEIKIRQDEVPHQKPTSLENGEVNNSVLVIAFGLGARIP